MSEPIIYLNGWYVREAESRIPILTHCLHYGTGVFEGIRGYHQEGGEIFLFRARDHFERMARNGRLLGLHLPVPAAQLEEVAVELVRRNEIATDVYLRPLAFKSAQRVGVTLPAEESFAMIAVPMGRYLDTRKGLHCGVSSWRRIKDNAIPCRAKICGAYVNSALASQEARERGFDEAIFLNEEGHVVEGSAENLFVVRKGRLITPDPAQGILEGITRDSLMLLAREMLGIETEERAVDRSELYVADEVLLCGTAAEVAPVTWIDGRMVGNGEPGEITLRLQGLYERAVHGELAGYRHWTVPVMGEAAHGKAGAA